MKVANTTSHIFVIPIQTNSYLLEFASDHWNKQSMCILFNIWNILKPCFSNYLSHKIPYISLSLKSKQTFFHMIHRSVEGMKKLDWATNQRVEHDWLKLQAAYLWSSFVYFCALAKRMFFSPLNLSETMFFLSLTCHRKANKHIFFRMTLPSVEGIALIYRERWIWADM